MMRMQSSTVFALGMVVVGLAFVHATTANEERHPCDRPCKINQPKSCRYRFVIDKYYTFSKACRNCPYNVTDCYKPDCIAATGIKRILLTANLQMPGPVISVCEYDNIEVEVVNRLGDATTSIHWHGIRQVGTPFQDGVPFITQCPINPYTTFRYQFEAVQPGTYLWRSHTTYQTVDGLAGLLIVRQPPNVDPNFQLYDFDNNKHVILISDWHNVTGDVKHGYAFQTNLNTSNLPTPNILVNGRGQDRRFTTDSGLDIYTPLESFEVKKGRRYRFRLGSNVNIECPVLMSVDNHSLTIISTDGNPVKPAVVSSVVVYPGERYDFVINANKKIDNYWIRFQGVDPCRGSFTGAILKYEDSADISLTEKYVPSNVEINSQTLTNVVRLESVAANDVSLLPNPEFRFFLPITAFPDFNNLNNPWINFPRRSIRLINGIVFNYPPSPLLTQLDKVPERLFCDESTIGKNCTEEYCSCVYRIKVSLTAVVELVIINTGDDTFSHDIHLHGYNFRVVGRQSLGEGNNTVANFKLLDEQSKIPRKLNHPVVKDTVGIPAAGYAIVRFKADNPGFWLLQDHPSFSTVPGLGLVFQVGDPAADFVPVPPGVPRCGTYDPEPLPLDEVDDGDDDLEEGDVEEEVEEEEK